MTMRVRLGEVDATIAAFGCSPAHEMLRSLHVLCDVKHFPLHISWVLHARTRLSPHLKADADAFGFWYRDRPLVFPRIWRQAEAQTWGEEESALRRAPVENFADQLIHAALLRRRSGDRISVEQLQRRADLQEMALATVEAAHPASLPVMREMIADPGACRDRFADFLSAYWESCLAPDWPGMQAQLREDIARRGLAASRRGLASMLIELSPNITGDHQAGVIEIRRPGRRDAEPIEVLLTDRDQILLVPSYFVWPELTAITHRDRTEDGERHTVLITYAVAGMELHGRMPIPPVNLLMLLRAAGDPTRLQILQLLAQRSRSTREIAGLIRLTEAAASKHLKLLQRAGWVTPERHSYYVFYRIERETLTLLTTGLKDLLG